MMLGQKETDFIIIISAKKDLNLQTKGAFDVHNQLSYSQRQDGSFLTQ